MATGTDPEWKIIIEKFPSAKREAISGMDCFAFQDWPGSVFHMARIGELGLRTIATERGVTTVRKNTPIEYGMWGDVFDAIENKLKKIRIKSAGPQKSDALKFYEGALSDLRFLRNYRDETMHFREEYGRGEAYDAIYRVKALMKTLAGKLDENSTISIDWGFPS